MDATLFTLRTRLVLCAWFKIRAHFVPAVVVNLAILASTSALAELRHQYTFEGPSVGPGGLFQDTVGQAHGALYGQASIADGKLILPGGGIGITGDHARLQSDGPDGININRYKNATFTIWATSDLPTPPVWSRYWDIGGTGTSRPGSAGNSVFLTPNATAQREIQFTISNVNVATQHGLDNFQRLPITTGPTAGKLYHLVVTYDGDNDVGKLFVDGRVVAENSSMTHQLELMQTDYALLGASLYASDNTFPGSISQFEIYDTALSPQEVLNLYMAGPIRGPQKADLPSQLAAGQLGFQGSNMLEVVTWIGGGILILILCLLSIWVILERKQIPPPQE